MFTKLHDLSLILAALGRFFVAQSSSSKAFGVSLAVFPVGLLDSSMTHRRRRKSPVP
jgi:hypothetical protein